MANSRNMLLLLSQDAKVNEALGTNLDQKGYQVYSVADQTEAVRKMRTKAVDLIIVDTSKMDPNDAKLQEYLKQQIGQTAPVILISSDLGDEQKQWFKRLPGVKAMLPKPLDLRQIERLIQSNLGKEAGIASLLADDDTDKPLVDERDRISIEIGVTLQALENGAPTGMVFTKDQVSLIEYSQDSLLLEAQKVSLATGQKVRISVAFSEGKTVKSVAFDGPLTDVEPLDDGRVMLTVSTQGASDQFLKEIATQVEKRQSEALGFIKRING